MAQPARAPAEPAGRRSTRARRAVLAVLERARGQQLTAQEVHGRARTLHPRIGLATVYRTLAALESDGTVEVVSREGGRSSYRLCSRAHHHHLVCTGCGTVVEVERCDIGALQRSLARRYRFRISDHALTLRGLCRRCA